MDSTIAALRVARRRYRSVSDFTLGQSWWVTSGHTVNVASRIEGLTKQHGRPILVSQATQAEAGEGFAWDAAPTVAVKGKVEPLATFAPARIPGSIAAVA